jgi:hypothetical protein
MIPFYTRNPEKQKEKSNRQLFAVKRRRDSSKTPPYQQQISGAFFWFNALRLQPVSSIPWLCTGVCRYEETNYF